MKGIEDTESSKARGTDTDDGQARRSNTTSAGKAEIVAEHNTDDSGGGDQMDAMPKAYRVCLYPTGLPATLRRGPEGLFRVSCTGCSYKASAARRQEQ